MLSQHLILLPNSGLAAPNSKASPRETTVDWKWKLALFKRPATEEKADSCPETSSKDSAWWWKFFKGRIIWGGGQNLLSFHCELTSFWLVGGEVTGWCSRNLVLNLKLTCSTWLGTFVPTRGTQRYCYICSLRKNQDPVHAALLFLDCFPSLPW